MTKILVITLTTIALLTSLTACGRRGPLEAPSAATNSPTTTQPKPAEDKPFVLDGLIQ